MQRFLLPIVGLIMCISMTPTRAASPDVSLNDLQGKSHHFSEYIGRGQWTVLLVWGPDCPRCTEQIPEMQGFHDDYNEGAAMVLGVAVDFPGLGLARRDAVAKFAQDHPIGFPLLLGSAESFTRFGGADLQGVPTTLIYDPKGAIVVRHAGSVTRDMIERFIAKVEAAAGK
jgi:peroxiredoxin